MPGRGGPDRILFFRDGALWTMPFGARRPVLTGSAAHVAAPVGSFRDGAFGSASADLLVYRGPDSNSQLTWLDRQGSPAESRTGTQGDLWLASLGDDGSLIPLLEEKFDQRDGVVSPDGLWLAYVSNESGVGQVFVRPLTNRATGLPVPGAATLVSRGGGTSLRWRDDGGELFYLSPEGAVMSADVTPTALGRPSELFRAPGALRH